MVPLGFIAPKFILPNLSNNSVKISFDEIKNKNGILIMFICNHCPYVKHIFVELIKSAKLALNNDIGVIAINSNNTAIYKEDSPENMQKLNLPFAYCFDESQAIAKAYKAACTPDFYLFNENDQCVYRGRFDNSSPGNNQPISGKDLNQAIQNLTNKLSPIQPQLPSIGCNIKWKE
jgi:thiol-disulfide isomerase/thioredoxin